MAGDIEDETDILGAEVPNSDSGEVAVEVEPAVRDTADVESVERISEDEDGDRKPSFESFEEQEAKVINNPDYLKFLHGLDQDYIDEKLDREGIVRVTDAAVISVDVAGFSSLVKEALAVSYGGGYEGSHAAQKVAARITPVRDEITQAVHLYGGEVDQFLGDGMNAMFRGGSRRENVLRAVHAAKILQKTIKDHDLDVRIGIDVGDVELVGYGVEEKRADMNGMAVAGAEAVQSQADATSDRNIVLTSQAYNEISTSKFVVVENEVYAWTDMAKADVIDPTDWMLEKDIPSDPEVVEQHIRSREKFLSRSRTRELRSEFLGGSPPRQDNRPVSTVFIQLNVDDKQYRTVNPVMTEIFDVASRLRGKIDKVHSNAVMINFIAGLNDINSVEASKLIADFLNEQRIEFKMAASRSNALVLTVDGVRTVYGDGVVRARRLLDVNNPGQVLVVDESTMERMLTRKIKSKRIPSVFVKGVDAPVERHVILEIERDYELPKGKNLVGREMEMRVLEEDFQRSRQGGRARIIVGEPGIGKSALTAEFLANQQDKGLQIMMGRAEPYTQKQAFAVWRNLFESSLSLQDMSVEDRQTAVKEFYSSNRAELLGSLALLNPILGTEFPDSDQTRYLDVAEREEKRADFVAQTLKSLTSVDMPTVVLLEDMHFFDESSEKLTRGVIQRLDDSDTYLILTTWPEDIEHKLKLPKEDFMQDLDNVDTLKLGGLPLFQPGQQYDYEQVRGTEEFEQWWTDHKRVWWEAVSSFIDLDKDDFDRNEAGYKRILTKLSQKTQGNFLYLGSALYYLVLYQGERRYFEESKIDPKYRVLGSKRIQDTSFDAIPDMEKIEQAKLDRLDVETKNVLLDASVVGLIFTQEIVAHISGLAEEKIENNLRYAEQKGFVKQLGGGQYMFVHGAIQDAVYNSIGDLRDRQLKHRVLAEYFATATPDDLPLLVRHLRNSDSYIPAMERLDRYAKQLKEQVLWGSALGQIKYASDIFEKIKGRGWKILDTTVSKRRDIELSAEEIDTLVDAQVERMFDAVTMWRLVGDRHQATDIVERAKGLFAETHPDFNQMSLHDQIIWARFYRETGEEETFATTYDVALADLTQARELLKQISQNLDNASPEEMKSYRDAEANLYDALGWLHKRTRQYAKALEYYQKGLPFTHGGARDIETSLRNGMAASHKDLGQLEDAERGYLTILTAARKQGNKSDVVVFSNNLAELNTRMGRLEKAEELYTNAMKLAKSISKITSVYSAKGGLAFVRRTRGDYQSAAALFAESTDFFADKGSMFFAEITKTELAFCLIKLGEFDKAERILFNLRKNEDKLFQGRSYTLGAMLTIESTGEVDAKAITDFERGIQLLLESRKEDDLAFDLLYFGELEMKHGRVQEGLAKIKEAKTIYERIQDLSEMGKIKQLLTKHEEDVSLSTE